MPIHPWQLPFFQGLFHTGLGCVRTELFRNGEEKPGKWGQGQLVAGPEGQQGLGRLCLVPGPQAPRERRTSLGQQK